MSRYSCTHHLPDIPWWCGLWTSPGNGVCKTALGIIINIGVYVAFPDVNTVQMYFITRMHSSRMHTTHSLTVSHWKNHAHPPGKPHTPPGATTHAPGATTYAPWEQPRMSPLEQPCTPLSNHACPPEQPHMPPRSNHACPPGATTHTPP